MASTHSQYEVRIGGRLVAIVNAESASQIAKATDYKPLPTNPAIPTFNLNNFGMAY